MNKIPDKYRAILFFLVTYYAIYTVIVAFVEPFGWFTPINSTFTSLGPWGNILLLSVPALITVFIVLFDQQKKQRVKQYLGLDGVSTGSNRDEAFQSIRKRAIHQIIVVGIGMTNISRYARHTLEQQAQKVPIDLLMIDPEFLKKDRNFAGKLEDFLGIPNFTESVQSSLETLKTFCDSWNTDEKNSHKIRLRVYSTIPTMSMVMIDPDDDSGELVIEFFLYQSGEYRPRFHILRIDSKDNLFSRVKSEYLRLWNSARRVA